jgi:uncharacterized protein (DUF2344 family)
MVSTFQLLEQERYTIQVKLEQKASMEAWYNEEISHLKQQLADRQSNLRATLEADKLQEVSRLNRQVIILLVLPFKHTALHLHIELQGGSETTCPSPLWILSFVKMLSS